MRGAAHPVDEKDAVIDTADIGNGDGIELGNACGWNGGASGRAQVQERIRRVQPMQACLKTAVGRGRDGAGWAADGKAFLAAESRHADGVKALAIAFSQESAGGLHVAGLAVQMHGME